MTADVSNQAVLRARLNRIQLGMLVLGIVALGVSVLGGFSNRQQFFFSYLFGCLFWIGLSLGCFIVTMIHQLTGGRWGYPTRRFLEAGFMNLPLMLVLFIPIFLGLKYIYPWAEPSQVAQEPLLQQRHLYQNTWLFVGR